MDERTVKKMKRLGARGESAAARHLRGQGFTILRRNYSCPRGEIDIIARKCDLVVFAEVKTLTTDAFLAPEEQVDREKQRRIDGVAELFIRRNGLENLRWRYDIISIVAPRWRRMRINHIPNAFEVKT